MVVVVVVVEEEEVVVVVRTLLTLLVLVALLTLLMLLAVAETPCQGHPTHQRALIRCVHCVTACCTKHESPRQKKTVGQQSR